MLLLGYLHVVDVDFVVDVLDQRLAGFDQVSHLDEPLNHRLEALRGMVLGLLEAKRLHRVGVRRDNNKSQEIKRRSKGQGSH